ncbi:MAG: hypothetical protein AB7K24_09915 [Gemmataceae bacterium]
MARIAGGAAAENIVRTARFNGWQATLAAEDAVGDRLRIALDDFSSTLPVADPVVLARCTNRKLYAGRPLLDSILARLRRIDAGNDIQLHWITDQDQLRALANLIGRADALMLTPIEVRRAFLGQVRCDAPPDQLVDEGLSLAALELSGLERHMLRLLGVLPATLLKLCGGLRQLADKSRRLVESSSGLCLVSTARQDVLTDWHVGLAAQRAWLALTEAGCQAQPMMSLPVLDSMAEHGTTAPLSEGAAALLAEFHSHVPEASRPAFLMRFGFAEAPSGRTGRLPVERFLATPGGA